MLGQGTSKEIHIHVLDLTIKGEVDSFSFTSVSRKHRKRCKACGVQFASFNSDKGKWSVWSSTLDEHPLPKSLAATAHMFYGTRVFDVADNLSKWEGYENKSKQIA